MNREPESEPEVQDDAIIGVAFRYSLWAIAVVALAGGIGWWWLSREEAPVVVDEPAPVAPVSAAGSDPAPPQFRFTDVTKAAGIEFEFVTGAYGERLLPETMVGGVAFFDFDSDGDPDILLTGGNHWPWNENAARLDQTVGLFVNDGHGGFERRDRELGLVTDAYTMGAAIGDYDGDGLLDVYLTAVGENLLFRNRDGRGFEQVTAAAGVAGGAADWSTGAAFFDADGDGWLDLVVVNYVAWSPAIDREVAYQIAGIGRAYGPPTNFPGTQPLYFVNRGDGTFRERAEAAGLWVENQGRAVAKALACYPRDLDLDGDVDLVVANDTTRNFVFLNDGAGRFREAGEELGLAFDNTGKATGAMGLDGTRLYRDGTLGIAIGNFANEMTSFYTTVPETLRFADDAVLLGIGPASRQALTFGVLFADFDLDGREELFQANGHIENEINRVQPSMHYAQPPQVFWNCGESCARPFVPVEETALGDLGRPLVGRGASFADIDLDGDIDLLIGQTGGGARLYRNDTPSEHQWLQVRLRDAAPNRFALGALVEVETPDGVQQRLVSPTRSYLSQGEFKAHFGLGRFAGAERVRVLWPGGGETVRADVAADQVLEIER